MKVPLCFFLLTLVPLSHAGDILPGEVLPGVPKGKMMEAFLRNLGLEALERRKTAFEKLADEDIPKWQEERREFFLRQLGGLPERCAPLNARVTGTLEQDGYRIEKVLFESQRGFHVTANLYLPEGKGPFPAVLHPTGHSSNAKNRALYQLASITIAKAGCAVLCYDPIGQGERDQVFDASGKPYSSTLQHTFINQGMHLQGSNTAQTMVWDGMRAIDYLQSRPDIRADKIGSTGISGGGTNTSYLMALDPRIVDAAPGCYLCGFGELLTTIGPQDAEQNIHGQLGFGMDHSDYVLMTLPRPTLIMAATKDYFPIQGAWDIFREGKRIATRLGYPNRVDLVEPNTTHGFPKDMRLASANWMRRWLLDSNAPLDLGADELKAVPEDQLNVLEDAAVLNLKGARSSFDLTLEVCNAFAPTRAKNAKPENREALVRTVRKLTGARELAQLPDPQLTKLKGNRWILRPEPGIFLPLQLVPAKGSKARQHVLVLNPAGADLPSYKEATASLHIDLRGLGETKKPGAKGGFHEFFGTDWKDTTTASLIGKTYVGMRVEDLCQTVRAWRKISGNPQLTPDLHATGEAAIPALHAAVLSPELFGMVHISHSIESWIDVVKTPVVRNQQPNLVFGALREYDLPMLRNLLGDRLTFEMPVPVDFK